MEMMGALAAERCITYQAIYRMWGGEVMAVWDKWQLAIHEIQRFRDDEDYFCNFETLFDETQGLTPRGKPREEGRSSFTSGVGRCPEKNVQ